MKKLEESIEKPGEEVPFGVAAPLDRVIPKFCTGIQVAVLETGSLVLSMYYSDAAAGAHALIDRVVVEANHARNLAKILLDATEQKVEGKDAN